MKKLKMKASKSLTFEEGYNKYLEYCRQRNLQIDEINVLDKFSVRKHISLKSK